VTDRTLRVLLTGDAAGAAAAFEETAVAADAAADEMDGKLSGASSKVGNIFEDLGSKLSNWGLPFGNSLTKMGEKMEEADSKGSSLIATMSGVGKVAIVAGAAGLAAFAAEGVHLAISFQAGMTSLVTGAGQSQAGLAKVANGILNMAGSLGTSTSDLTSGMYMIESAGYHGAQGLTVLKAAAEGAKVGAASLSDVASAVTSGLKDYGEGASQATSMTNQLVATVAAGKMHMSDLSTALAMSLPTAASSKIAYDQVGGAIATMTAQGVTARRASTNLANFIRAIIAPSATASAEMQKLGLNANQLSQNVGKVGLTGTLNEMTTAVLKSSQGGTVLATGFANMTPAARAISEQILAGTITTQGLTTAMQGLPPTQAKLVSSFEASATSATGLKQTYDAALKTMVGGATGLNVALELSGKNSKTFADNVKSIGDAAKKTGGSVTGFSKVQQDLGFQLDQLKYGAEALSIRLGEKLIPIFEDLGKIGVKVIEFFEKCKPAAIALGVAVGGPLVASIAIAAAEMGGNMVRSVISFGQSLLSPIESLRNAATASDTTTDSSAALAETLASLDKSLGLIAVSSKNVAIGFDSLVDISGTYDDTAAAIAASNQAMADSFDLVAAGADTAMAGMETLSAAAETTAEVMETAGPEAGEGFDAMLGPIGLVIIAGTLIATHWKLVEHLLEDAWNAIKSAAETVWGAIKAPFDDFLSFVENWGPLIAEIIAAPFTLGMSLILPTIISHWSTISSFFEGIPGDIESFFASAGSWLEKAGEDIIKGLWTGFELLTPLGEVIKWHNDILSALGDAGTWLLDAGKDIINGLLKGAESIVGKVTSFFSGLGKDVSGFFGKALGILSPSTVFAEHGANIMRGLAQGIEGNSGLAESAISRVASSLASTRFPTLGATGAAVAAAAGGSSANPYAAGAGAAAGAAGSSAPTGDLHITMNMNGQQLATAIMPDFRTVALTQKRGTVNLGLG
jgi:TP901 family phage tail tape measure protein